MHDRRKVLWNVTAQKDVDLLKISGLQWEMTTDEGNLSQLAAAAPEPALYHS